MEDFEKVEDNLYMCMDNDLDYYDPNYKVIIKIGDGVFFEKGVYFKLKAKGVKEIPRFHEYFLFNDVYRNKQRCIVIEKLDGNLSQFRIGMSDTVLKEGFIDVINALEELHKLGILHGGIKPDNILVKDNKFKLADFDGGFNIEYPKPVSIVVGNKLYTSVYAHNFNPYTFKHDLQSLIFTYIKTKYGYLGWEKFKKMELIESMKTQLFENVVEYFNDYLELIPDNITIELVAYNNSLTSYAKLDYTKLRSFFR
ncbi:putative serine/threonine protein kinase [Carp edema virus]|nr:putative serine/threonine protein kinase [Carp edema virus]